MTGEVPAERRRVRQADIARVAGVSQATVSLVVNDRDGTVNRISEATRRRVWNAVRQLEYQPNQAARILAGGRSSILGVYTFERVFPVDHRDFYHPFLLGMEEAAERLGYDLLLFTSASGAGDRRTIYREGQNRLGVADGCVLLGRETDRTDVRRLLRESFPVVFVGRREFPDLECAYVGADYVSATAGVVDHLVQLGHRSLALLSWPDRFEATADRRLGFTRAVSANRLDPAGCPVHRLDAEAVDDGFLSDLLATGVTGVIAQDHAVAGAVLDVAVRRGLTVPGDLSIAVLGDPPRTPRSDRAWTRFEIPRLAMGAGAIELLVDQIESGPGAVPVQHLLDCTWVQGETTAPPA